MDRRDFLKLLGTTAIGASVAPELLAESTQDLPSKAAPVRVEERGVLFVRNQGFERIHIGCAGGDFALDPGAQVCFPGVRPGDVTLPAGACASYVFG